MFALDFSNIILYLKLSFSEFSYEYNCFKYKYLHQLFIFHFVAC